MANAATPLVAAMPPRQAPASIGAVQTQIQELSKSMDLLLRIEARAAGVAINGVEAEAVRNDLQAKLEEEADGGDEESEDGGGEDMEEDDEPQGRVQEDVAATRHTEIMNALQSGAHTFCRPANGGKFCGVCTAKWNTDDTWTRGTGKWGACLACQVYLCSFECLNEHIKPGGVRGNAIKAGHKIFEHHEDFEAFKRGE